MNNKKPKTFIIIMNALLFLDLTRFSDIDIKDFLIYRLSAL